MSTANNTGDTSTAKTNPGSQDHTEENLTQKINRETARIHWKALEPHFAAGQLITVATELDLILVARAMAEDDATTIKRWMDKQQLMPTSDQQAAIWQEINAELWAAVIKPWVLVQAVVQK
jgi:hypothetical protein